MIIDWQHHLTPRPLVERGKFQTIRPGWIAKYPPGGKIPTHTPVQIYQLESHVAFMDEAGIDKAVMSSPVPRSVEDCKVIAETYAEVLTRYPDRFVCFASYFPSPQDEALKELEREITTMGLKGVMVSPQMEGRPLDSEELWPFYQEVSRLKIPIFVHVTGPIVGYDAFHAKFNFNVTLTREFDIANATVRIILGGVLSAFPDLRFVIAHMGGGISAVKERLTRYMDAHGERFWTDAGGTPPFGQPYSRNFERLFGELYFDMAGYEGGMNAVKCALTTISPKRLVFGTDYPFNFTDDVVGVKRYVEDIRGLDMPAGSVEAMLGGNAAEILGL